MKKLTGTCLLIILTAIVLFGVFSCSQPTAESITQQQYDAVKTQLSAAEARIAQLEAAPALTIAVPEDPALKDEVASLKVKLTTLGTEIAALNGQNNNLKTEKASLGSQYAELTAKYQELQQTLADLTQPKIITEELVENAVFRLINQERVAAGLAEFQQGRYLYQQAKQNGRDMEAANKFVYTTAVFYQENFWAAGYNSVEGIARGALLTWKLNKYNYEHGALLPGNVYGAVGAYKSGEIYYVTFMAAFFP